eukprot:scaffold2015_cov92-Isochrysis_galbana.AAC.1
MPASRAVGYGDEQARTGGKGILFFSGEDEIREWSGVLFWVGVPSRRKGWDNGSNVLATLFLSLLPALLSNSASQFCYPPASNLSCGVSCAWVRVASRGGLSA